MRQKLGRGASGAYPASFLLGAVIHATIFFAYLMPYGSPPIISAGICCMAILLHLNHKQTVDKHLALLFCAMIALVLWGMLTRTILTGEITPSFRGANYYLAGFLLIPGTAYIVQNNEERMMSFFRGLFWVATIGVIISFANYYTSFYLGVDFLVDLKRAGSLAQFHRSRLMGTVGNPNNFATIVLVPLVISLTFLAEKFKWSTYLLFMLFVMALVFASSRGVLLGFAAVCVLALWRAMKKRNAMQFVMLLFAPALLSAGLLVLGSNVARIDQLLGRICGDVEVSSVQIRFDVWMAYFVGFWQNPSILIFGSGINNYLVSHPPENSYIKLVNEFGIPISLAFVSLIGLLGYALSRTQECSLFSRIGFYLIISMMVANLSNEVIDSRSFWLALGIAYSCFLLSRYKACHSLPPIILEHAG